MLTILFSQHLRNEVSLPLISLVSDEKSTVIQFVPPHPHKYHFSLPAFKILSLPFIFQKFEYNTSWWISLVLSYLGFTQLLNSSCIFLSNLASSQPLFECFLGPTFFLNFSYFDFTNMIFLLIPQFSEAPFFCFRLIFSVAHTGWFLFFYIQVY